MILAPSILSADFGHLAREIEMLQCSDAQWIHCDVMDGVFVPNISFGFPVIEAVSKLTTKPLDVHLMIVDPDKYISQVRDSGATLMNVHQEVCTHLHRTIDLIKGAGMKAAVTLNPATPVETLVDIITDLDMVLLMSVNPGFGSQKFIMNTFNKIARLRRLIDETGSKALIEIDGGVRESNVASLVEAGADVLVAGSAVFGDPDPQAAIRRMFAAVKKR